MKHPPAEYVGDTKVRDLLSRYDCPVPFHAVRTRFLGSIATPRDGVSPIETVKNLWPDKLPEFDDMDAVNELFQRLMSLWNHLTRHQSRSKPFRLTRENGGLMADDLRRLCQTRFEEIEGFIDGIFGNEEEMDLPERADEGMDHLGKIYSMVRGLTDLVTRKPGEYSPGDDVATIFKNVKELSLIAEKEIHAVVLSCKRARAQSVSQTGPARQTFH